MSLARSLFYAWEKRLAFKDDPGLEVGGGLRYQHPAGLIAEGRARRLAMHEGTIREWGVGVLLRFDPGMVGRGLSVSLAPSWGETVSGVQHVWEHGATDLVPRDVLGMRMDTRVGYGLRAFRGRVVLSPEMSLARGMDTHEYLLPPYCPFRE